LPAVPVRLDDGVVTHETSFGVLPATGTGQIGPPTDASWLVDLAVRAESLGFASVWANDSLYRSRVEPLALLSSMAAVTRRVTLGTAAPIPAYRPPVQAAQAIATLDLLSRGRLVLGVGAGFPGRSDPDFALAGVPTQGRSARLDDIVGLWRRLWSGAGPTGYRGRVLNFESLPDPLPMYRPGGPPVWLAAGSDAALTRCGRHYDGWLPYPPTPQRYAEGLRAVRAAARRCGRDPAALTPALFVTVAVADDPTTGRRMLDESCHATYRAPVEFVEQIQLMIGGPPDHIRHELGRFLQAGARHIVVRLAGTHPAAQIEQLSRVADTLLAVPAHTRSEEHR
jgi:alkanesulfonate monooxygenase SsuD/methylene tetrahydromethanopterin reductase-like flavin-dependent oxidoreductase (luciferase family)